jgi:N-acetylgalactosamine kinase
MRPLSEWLKWLGSFEWQRWAKGVYGAAGIQRLPAFRALLSAAADRWGLDTPVILVRSPGRLNLMGRHIDHRGGFVHPIALPREILLAVQPRNDDLVAIHHTQLIAFPSHFFRFGEVAPPRPMGVDEWERWTRQKATERKVAGWAIYAEAAAATLVNWHAALGISSVTELRGINAVVDGDIPPEAGLSSSSALFVAFLLALLHRNAAIPPRPSRLSLAELCGYGEWFVGTRGGAGDHAAILLAQRGKVLRISFFPMTVETLPFPDDLCLLVMDSGERAHKASSARREFNLRVAAYEVGMMLWHERFPELRDRLRHLRDATPKRLGSSALTYRLLQALPERISFGELSRALPHRIAELSRLAANCDALSPSEMEHTFTEPRGVCWFGIAECERSERFADALREGDGGQLGELMTLSHDGDRVMRWRNGVSEPFRFPTDDAQLVRMEAEGVPMWRQAGSYRCSTPALDFLVDAALQAGALGAQLSGAGLGGCVMALAHRNDAERIAQQVTDAYAKVLGRKLTWFIAEPCDGAEVLSAPPQ